MSDIIVLNDRIYEGAINLPVITFKFYDKSVTCDSYEALVFTSINGVKALNRISNSWLDIPSYAIGEATYHYLKKVGANVVYRAKSSYGDHFAKEIKDLLEGKRVLFCRPSKVTSNLNNILKANGVLLDEIILYETICVNNTKTPQPKSGSTIIFSSPSTIECFFKYFSWDKSYNALVLGTKTASFMPPHVRYEISPQPNIEVAIKFARDLSKKGL